MDTAMAILLGIGLSAAAGFRVFIPLLIVNILAKLSYVTLAENFDWLGSTSATIAVSLAVILELASSVIPVIDNIVKVLATPLAIGAGIILVASFMGGADPTFRWVISIVAGGGTATLTQIVSTTVRGTVNFVTAGAGGIVVTIFETLIAIIVTILSILMPILSLVFLGVIIYFVMKVMKKRRDVSGAVA
ncbi:MAG TPA: DUF4126 domain-containing protein [Pseudogracilibacillus sp.]|nr:DUF4126 domain-containing protein [Pseudogracilibacillus sp.]